jgi:hypothetical protein
LISMSVYHSSEVAYRRWQDICLSLSLPRRVWHLYTLSFVLQIYNGLPMASGKKLICDI